MKINQIGLNRLRNDTHFQFHTEFKDLAGKYDAYLPIYDRVDLALKKMKKFGFITVLLTIVLVFALTPSLAAQNTLSWNKRTLVGMPYRNSDLSINNVKFRTLHGGGDERVVSIMDNNGKETGKTQVEKITKLPYGQYYKITLSTKHYLEVTGTHTESGLTGQVFYIIKGPTELFLNTSVGWPNVSIGVSPEYWTWIYFDQASFDRDIAVQFVDSIIVPAVDYNKMTQLYNDTKKKFTDHVDGGKDKADKEKRSKECPEKLSVCICNGNIAQHIITSAAKKQGYLGGAIGTLPLPFAVAAEVANGRKKIQQNAVLAALIGKHYGWYNSKKEFDERFRNHALVLFSGADVPSAGAAAAGEVKEEMVMKSAGKLFKTLAPRGLSAIPGIGKVIGIGFGGIISAKETRTIGNDAVRFYNK